MGRKKEKLYSSSMGEEKVLDGRRSLNAETGRGQTVDGWMERQGVPPQLFYHFQLLFKANKLTHRPVEDLVFQELFLILHIFI